MTINTRKSERRELKFTSLDDLDRELSALQAAHAAGTLRTTGNWTPGQNFQHCARFWKAAIDGFPSEMKPPLLIKWGAQLLFKKKAISGVTAPAGIQLPRKAKPILPEDSCSFEQGLAEFREQIERTRRGAKFTAVSSLFGAMSHDEWQRLQFGHCQSHLGFLHPK